MSTGLGLGLGLDQVWFQSSLQRGYAESSKVKTFVVFLYFGGFENWTIKKNLHVLKIQIYQNFG